VIGCLNADALNHFHGVLLGPTPFQLLYHYLPLDWRKLEEIPFGSDKIQFLLASELLKGLTIS